MFHNNSSLIVYLLACFGYAAIEARAQSVVNFEPAADKLRRATVTVSVTDAADDPGSDVPTTTVCSGVIVGPGLIVSSIDASTSDMIRVTGVDGERHAAKLAVIDHFTSLSLLEVSGLGGDGLATVAEPPNSGTWIISAAAWGQSDPIVTHGMISSTQRTRGTSPSPPLLQCDLRTVETSSGAAIVGASGDILGIVVATSRGVDDQPGTFAVAAAHVQRLLRARQPHKLVVLRRQRPTVGLVLCMGDQPNQVLVERVDKSGPAGQVGIQAGDEIVSVDGRRIRWVYEALQPVLQRQPGDTLRMRARRNGQLKTFDLVLGGGIALPAEGQDTVGTRFARRLSVSRVSEREFAVHDHQGHVRNLRFDEPLVPKSNTSPQVVVLEKALDRYGRAIVTLRDELRRRDRQREEALQRVDQLQREIEDLRQELAKPSRPEPRR